MGYLRFSWGIAGNHCAYMRCTYMSINHNAGYAETPGVDVARAPPPRTPPPSTSCKLITKKHKVKRVFLYTVELYGCVQLRCCQIYTRV